MLGHRTLEVEDYLWILKRRWWMILIPLAILPIVALAISYTIPPQYLSQALVLIEGQKVPDNYVKPVISSDLDSRLSSMKEQILSRSRIQPIVEKYNLYATEKMSMDERIDLARKSIDIKPIASEIARGLPGFYITFKAGDANTAKLVCGEVTSLFLGENLRSREASAEGTTDFLKSQLADAKRNLDEQDAKLAAFQKQYMGRMPGEESPNVNMLSSLNSQLEASTQALGRMEQDKSFAETMLAQQNAAQPAPVPGVAAGMVSTVTPGQMADLQALTAQEADLSSHYTADYPDVIAVRRKLADLKKQMAKMPSVAVGGGAAAGSGRYETPAIQQLRAQIQAANVGIEAKRREQAQIQAGIHTYQDRIQSSPEVEEQFKELNRGYTSAQTFYDDLLGKMNGAKMATDLEKRQQGEQLVLVDEANLPAAPFSPKRGMFAIGGIVGGLGLGLLIVAGLEYKDTALRTERDVYAFTKLPTLAVIAFAGTGAETKAEGHENKGLWARMVRLFSRKRTKQAFAPAGN